MDQRWIKIFRVVTYLLVAWFLVSTIGRLHSIFLLLITALAISNVAIVWMLREHRLQLAVACRRTLFRKYMGCICYFTSEQLPLETTPDAKSADVLLRSQHDCEMAFIRARQIVRGHDSVLERIFARISENQTLRMSRRNTESHAPLASFFLVGRDGVGKRYLMRVLSKLLYGSGGVEVFDCAQLTVEILTGTKEREGELLEIVRKRPHTLILFEHIEKASAEVSKLLVLLLTTGKLRQPGTTSPISFQEATVTLTTTKTVSLLEALKMEQVGETVWQQRAIELIGDETRIEHSLLHAVTDVCFCASPTELIKAEVIALQMQKECRAHHIELSNVDPEILATQVLLMEDALGFQLVPQRVKKLLRKPLVAAVPAHLRFLSLRVQTVETIKLR